MDRLDRLVTLVAETPMIGEIGLDHHWVKDPAAYPAQMRVLEFFLAAVRDQEKVVNLHTKSAEREVAQALRRFPSQKSDSRGITVTYRSAARAIERPGRAAALA